MPLPGQGSALNLLRALKWLINSLLLPFDFELPFSAASLSLGSSLTGFRGQIATNSARLSELVMPTLLVWGTRDPVVPFQQAYTAEQVIPDCRVRIFEGSGHSVYRERLDEFSQALCCFLG